MSGSAGPAGWVRANGSTSPGIIANPWQWIDPRKIPPRRWLLGTTLLRGYSTLLGSPGGVGKTTWAIAAALSVITGRQNILGLHSFVQGNVWIATLEDDRTEIDRRIAAAMDAHQVAAVDIGDSLLITDQPIKLVEYAGRRGAQVATPTQEVEDAKQFITDNNVVLAVIDPLVKAHAVNGNANEDMNVLIETANLIARDTGCSLLLPCHFRKGGSLDGDDRDAFRGASSLVDGARIALGMLGMSKAEADLVGVKPDDAGRFVRMVNAKANMTPRADATDWYELVDCELGNTAVDLAYPAGDHVQAIRKWLEPGLMDGMDHAVLKAIFGRLGDTSQIFHATSGANRNWAGQVIVTAAAKSKDQARRILQLWLDSGTLEQTVYKNSRREDRIKLTLNVTKASEILASLAATQMNP